MDKNNRHSTTLGLMASLFFLSLSSCSVPLRSVSSSFETSESGKEESSSGVSLIEGEEAKSKFIGDFTASLKGGVSLSIEEGLFEIDGNVDGAKNQIDFSDTSLAFGLSGLSLHNISLALDAPISYNGVSRFLGLFLHEDQLYFKVASPENATDEAFQGDSIRYTVDLSAYLGEHIEEANGDRNYEYGDLSWIIDNITGLLSGEGSDVNLSGTSSFHIDWEVLAGSLDRIFESTYNGKPYFVWPLQLEEGGTVYEIGLRSTSTYEFAGIDAPSLLSSTQTLDLSSSMRLKIRSSVETEQGPLDWQAPSDAASYTPLVDSLGLIKRIARFFGDQDFSMDLDLSIYHHEEAIPGTETTFGREEVNEGLYIEGGVSVDMNSWSLDQIGMDVTLNYLEASEENEEITYTPNGEYNRIGLEVANLPSSDKGIYVNLNDAVKIQTNKWTLDSLINQFDGVSLPGSANASGDGSAMSNLLASLDSILRQVEELQKSDFGKGLSEGHYESILAALDHISASEESISLSLNLEKAGLGGSMAIEFSGREPNPLAEITFHQAKFAFFTLEGTISMGDFSLIELEGKEDYSLLEHLPNLAEQIGVFVPSLEISASLEGYVLKLGTETTTSVSSFSRVEQGSEFFGSFAFNLKDQLGAGGIAITNKMDTYYEKHYVQVDVSGPEISEDDSTDNQMYLKYWSEGASSSPLMGRMSIHSLNSLIQVVMSLMGNTDPRFERITGMMSGVSSASLLSDITSGHFLSALSSRLISSLTVAPDLTTVVFPKALLGLADDLTVKLHFGEKSFHREGQESLVLEKALTRLEVSTKTGSEESMSEVYFSLTINELDIDTSLTNESGYDALHANFGPTPSLSSFTDFSSLSNLLSHLIDTMQLGMTDSNSLTTFHLNGVLDLNLKIGFSIPVNSIPIDAFITLNGAEVNVYGRMELPKIDLTVFTAIPKKTVTEFFYHTDGKDPVGTLLLRRYQTWSEGILWNKKTYHVMEELKVSGDDFMANILDWILFYMMAMDKDIYGLVYPDGQLAETTKGPIHGEDALRSYSSGGTVDEPSWTIGLDLQELTGLSVSMNITPTITGCKVVSGSKTKTSVRTLTGSFDVVSVVVVNPDITVTNLVAETGGYGYHDCWNDNSYNAATYDMVSNNSYSAISSTSIGIFEQFFFVDGDYTDAVKAMEFTAHPPLSW